MFKFSDPKLKQRCQPGGSRKCSQLPATLILKKLLELLVMYL